MRISHVNVSSKSMVEERRGQGVEAHLFQRRDHDVGPVVDSEHNVGHTSGCEALDLVQDHRAVGKLDEGLG